MFIHDYHSIISLENILKAWKIFVRGKKYKKDVVEYALSLSENLIKLQKDLENRNYSHGKYVSFNISDPKPRIIHKATVIDRLVHNILYKELYWYFDKRFIYDSYSCRVNKGVYKANLRFKQFAGRVSKNNTRTCYILKCDIKKFFASIDHKILENILKRHIKDVEILNLINNIISSFSSIHKGVGLPLGNLTSQLLVNIYMHEFDIYVKQELRVKYYIRYADDFAIFCDDKKYLKDILEKLELFLIKKLKLKLHDHKVYIKTYSSGVDFLGWTHFPNYKQLRNVTKKNIIRKLHKYSKPETINSYRGLLSHGNTYKLKKYIKIKTNIDL